MVTQALHDASVAASNGDPSDTYKLANLPNYLREVFGKLQTEQSSSVSVRSLVQIRDLPLQSRQPTMSGKSSMPSCCYCDIT